VRGEVEAEEERRVRERRGRDLRLAGDVDAREADASQEACDQEVEELAVAEAETGSYGVASCS
jgi:hypothetical protein